MELQRKEVPQVPAQPTKFAEPEPRKPLELLRDTERSLRLKTVETLAPLLSEAVVMSLEAASATAEDSLNQLAEVDWQEISDQDLRPVRLQVGLLFIGFGALTLIFLLLYIYTLHPKMNAAEQLQHYWYPYIGFVSLGITGLFMIGREAIRSQYFDE